MCIYLRTHSVHSDTFTISLVKGKLSYDNLHSKNFNCIHYVLRITRLSRIYIVNLARNFKWTVTSGHFLQWRTQHPELGSLVLMLARRGSSKSTTRRMYVHVPVELENCDVKSSRYRSTQVAKESHNEATSEDGGSPHDTRHRHSKALLPGSARSRVWKPLQPLPTNAPAEEEGDPSILQ